MSKSFTCLAMGVFACLLSVCFETPQAFGQTGKFVALLNEGNFGDSPRTVSFFDATSLGAGPMFSVFMGYDQEANREENNTLTINPATGDVYVLSTDSLDAAVGEAQPAAPANNDTVGDFDLRKIDFSLAYNHWEANFKGENVRTLGGALAVGGPAPTGFKNAANLDYVTYGANLIPPYSFNFELAHSNTFVLPGVIEKLGEIKRNETGEFFPYSLEFIDDETLFLLDNSSAPTATDTPETDHEYRLVGRVSTSPGMADNSSLDHLDGGFNRGTTQSWNSRRIGKVHLDTAAGVPTGHSEVETTAYYRPSATLHGVWVAESDGGGDDIAFLELDSNNAIVGYRQLNTGGTAFALDDNPAVSTATNDGKVDNIMVDEDTGDLIIMESGFQDATPHQPGVLRLAITSYDNGSGQIEVGAWSEKVIMNPMLTPGEDPATFLERGQWTAWNSVDDQLYIFNPGAGGSENPQFEMDITVIDLKVGSPTYGVTTTFLEIDDSLNLFNGDSFGDKVEFFFLGNETVADADFDNDNDVDGADFLTFQRGFGVGTTPEAGDANGDNLVNADDLAIFRDQFGVGVPATAAAGAVPEPSTAALLLGCALGGLWLRRRA